MSRMNMSVKIRPPQNIISRNVEAYCSSPADNWRNFVFNSTYVDDFSQCVMLEHSNNPADYLWGKGDYNLSPDADTNWIEASNPLGKGGKSVGWSGTPLSTAWMIYTSASIDMLRGVNVSILWHRSAGDINSSIEIFPRMDTSITTTIDGRTYWFCPFHFKIDNQNFIVNEYPYDDYTAFNTAADTSLLQEVYSHPLVTSSTGLGSEWMSFWIQPLSSSDLLVTSNVLSGGGFVYRSALERENINMFPSGNTGVRCLSGGLSQVQITPTDYAETGTFMGDVIFKQETNNEYPTVSIFGWSKSTGFLDNTVIPAGSSVGGISFKIINPATMEEIPATGTPEFGSFRYQITMIPDGNVTPVVNDIVCTFEQELGTDISDEIDVSENVISIRDTDSSEFAGYSADIVIHNPDGIYNNIALRPANEIDIDIDGVDRAVLYTLNPSYEMFTIPTQGALKLEWACGDGFELLKNTLVFAHPPYDGQLVSSAITDFAKRVGIPAAKLDIAETTGVYLPKKRYNEDFQFKPVDGTTAFDFLQQLQEWFAGVWTLRFSGDGKLTLEDTSSVVIAKTYYMKTTTGQFPVYEKPKVELMHDQFYNEIWVVGKDYRSGKSITATYVNKPSQSDPSADDYVGKRNLMIVATKINSQGVLNWICSELTKFHGVIRARMTFKTKFDPSIRTGNYIKINESAMTWKIQTISTTIDHTTEDQNGSVHDCEITAIQWPVTV